MLFLKFSNIFVDRTTDSDTQSGYGLLGCCRCMLANRVAFTFDFRGPSFTIDTACSSSMFALDAAFKVREINCCIKSHPSYIYHINIFSVFTRN